MLFDMVFEGGGAKGTVFVGALEVFTEQGHSFGRLLGTSAGAITATLLAAGYTPAELRATLAEKEGDQSVFAGFMGPPSPFQPDEIAHSNILKLLRGFDARIIPNFLEKRIDVKLATWMATNPSMRHLFAFVERGGWYSADRFVTWFRQRLNTGSWRGGPRRFGDQTLAQFHAVTGVDLTLIASDTTAQEMLILNHRTAPDLPLAWAVRMSMSIPLLWQEVVWDAAWGSYRGGPRTGHTVVDGGLLSNFPIALLVSRDADVTAVMGPTVSDHVLGMLIDEAAPVAGAPPLAAEQTGFHLDELRTVQRLSRLVDTVLGARDKMVIDALSDFVVRLPAGGYGTTEFDMTEPRRASLLAAGRAAMQQHLDNAAASEALSFDPTAEPSMPAVPPTVRKAADRQALRILRR